MAPKLKRTTSSLSRKSLHRLDTNNSTAAAASLSRRNSSVKIQQEENENSLDEVLEEEDSNDNEEEDEEEDQGRNKKHDDDTVSVNSIEREMTLKDRQEVSHSKNTLDTKRETQQHSLYIIIRL